MAGLAMPGLALGCGVDKLIGGEGAAAHLTILLLAVVGQPVAFFAHTALVPERSVPAPKLLLWIYCTMSAIWCASVFTLTRELLRGRVTERGALVEEATDSANECARVAPLMRRQLDLFRALVMMILTASYGVLLRRRRIGPWEAFRNLAALAPAVTGAWMLMSLSSLGCGQVYTPNETPLTVAILRMTSSIGVAIASCYVLSSCPRDGLLGALT